MSRAMTTVVTKVNSVTKRLAAFDFDHTILNDNSDTCVANLLKPLEIPDSVKQLRSQKDGWTAYMQEIFDMLYKQNINKDLITKTVEGIPQVPGMVALIKELSHNLNFDLIIISDANSYFIEKWLEFNSLSECFVEVFTNPSVFVDGKLKIEMFHVQDTCNLSTRNLCKGQVLDDFIKSREQLNISYNEVFYVGDGRNDFCPMLRLSESDVACPREGYLCQKMINSCREGQPLDSNGTAYDIKASVCVWKDGLDLLQMIKERLNSQEKNDINI